MINRSNYKRVTSIIKATEDPIAQKRLMAWQKKMDKIHGFEGAKIARQDILDNGTNIHSFIETYLYTGICNDRILPMKSLLDSILSENRNDGLTVEKRMYSDIHQITGKPDLIATVDGMLTIVDWTTSQRLKKKQWVEQKFLQAGAYSLMFEELWKAKIQQLMVVVFCEDQKRVQVFTDEVEKWGAAFIQRLDRLKEEDRFTLLESFQELSLPVLGIPI